MSSSQTSTIPMPSQEQYTSINRVAKIPLVDGVVGAIVSAINANSYTRSGFCTAKDWSSSAYKYAEPYQTHFTPILQRADGYANKTIDVAQQTFPAAFETKPEDVAAFVRERTQSATGLIAASRDSVNKVIDERVKSPAISVAEGVDRGCTKLVDAFEVVVSKTSDGKTPTGPIETQYQYQRAFALSKNLKDNVYCFSAEQWTAIQEHNRLVQTAITTTQSINQAATSSLANAQDQVKQLSNRMITELQNIQASSLALYNSLQSTASNTVHNSTTQLQNQTAYAQQKLSEVSAPLASMISDMQDIMKQDVSFQQKASNLASYCQERTLPLLDGLKNGFLSRNSSPTQEQSPQMNGNGIH